MSSKIQTYVELQRMIRKALREQNPEWIDANGRSDSLRFLRSSLC